MGAIRVTVLQDTSTDPVVGDYVVFTDLVQTQVVQTDANGVATASVVGATSVTEIHDTGNPTGALQARSILGAMPGDDILLKRRFTDYTARAPITVNFTAASSHSYRACTPCDCATRSVSPLSIPVPAYCAASTVDVVFVDAANDGSTAAYSYVTGTPYNATSGATVTITSTLPAPLFTGTYTNVPAGLTQLLATRDSSGMATSDAVSNPPAMVTIQKFGAIGADARRITTVEKLQGEYATRQVIYETVPVAASTYTLDLQSALLKWIDEPVLDPSKHMFTVPTSSSGAEGDLTIFVLSYNRTVGGNVVWEIFMRTPADFTIPEIPASVFDMSMSSLGSHYVDTFESAAVNGWDQTRLDPYVLWGFDWAKAGLTGFRASFSLQL